MSATGEAERYERLFEDDPWFAQAAGEPTPPAEKEVKTYELPPLADVGEPAAPEMDGWLALTDEAPAPAPTPAASGEGDAPPPAAPGGGDAPAPAPAPAAPEGRT